MTSKISGETIGQIVTPLGHDGTAFRPLLVDSSGRVVVYGPDSGRIGANLYGNVGGVWTPVKIHETGYLYVLVGSMPSVTVSVVNLIAEGQIKNHIYDGSDWQPQRGDQNGIAYVDVQAVSGHADAMAWHIKEPWRAEYEFAATAGQVYVTSDIVPSGEIWVATNVAWWNNTHAGTRWILMSRGNSIDVNIDRQNVPVAGEYRITVCLLYLEAGAYLRATFEGASVGDVLRMHIHGYKMYAS